MAFFWTRETTEEALDDLPEPGAEDEEKQRQEAALKRPGMMALLQEQEEEAAPVQWPPVKPLPPAEGDRKSGRTRGGRDRRRRAGDKSDNFKDSRPDYPKKEGWLPKAEYEAKKQEEQRRREMGKGRDRPAQGKGSKGEGKGKNDFRGKGFKGDDGRPPLRQSDFSNGRGARAWNDLPPRPPPPEETSESKARREREDLEQQTRDRLRNATSADEMTKAIAKAQELGLKQEASVGERKLQKMQEA
mmetsp:Transcript_17520/g.20719  ORF Transcript_17520/g.20719 Transcript_17520/m.20719 type:complete len:245 (-) Transcript_17520:76-810(-)